MIEGLGVKSWAGWVAESPMGRYEDALFGLQVPWGSRTKCCPTPQEHIGRQCPIMVVVPRKKKEEEA